MTLQPIAAEPVDAELWLTGYLRTWLAARPESYAAVSYLGTTKPAANRPRTVVVESDGGPVGDVFQTARLRIRVWADKSQEASDLARLIIAGIKVAPGNGPCVAVPNIFGPSQIPDSSQPQRLVNAEILLRCTVL